MRLSNCLRPFFPRLLTGTAFAVATASLGCSEDAASSSTAQDEYVWDAHCNVNTVETGQKLFSLSAAPNPTGKSFLVDDVPLLAADDDFIFGVPKKGYLQPLVFSTPRMGGANAIVLDVRKEGDLEDGRVVGIALDGAKLYVAAIGLSAKMVLYAVPRVGGPVEKHFAIAPSSGVCPRVPFFVQDGQAFWSDARCTDVYRFDTNSPGAAPAVVHSSPTEVMQVQVTDDFLYWRDFTRIGRKRWTTGQVETVFEEPSVAPNYINTEPFVAGTSGIYWTDSYSIFRRDVGLTSPAEAIRPNPNPERADQSLGWIVGIHDEKLVFADGYGRDTSGGGYEAYGFAYTWDPQTKQRTQLFCAMSSTRLAAMDANGLLLWHRGDLSHAPFE